jgi:acyl carrier protein
VSAYPNTTETAPDVVHVVAALFTELLDVPDVDPDEEFFVLGGSSITAMRLLERIQEELGVTVSAGAFYRATTVADLAAVVRAALPTVSTLHATEDPS